MKDKLITIGIAVVLSVFVSALILANPAPSGLLGGRVHNVQEDFSEGIAVDGTERLSGTGSITADDLSASDDLAVTDDVFVTSDLVVGSAAASSSTSNLQINDTVATASLTLDSALGLGSCIEMRNTAGAAVYARVVSTTWTVTTVSCK